MKTTLNSLQMKSSDDRLDGVNITSRLLNLVLDMTLDEKLKLLNELDRWGIDRSRRNVRKPWATPVKFSDRENDHQDLLRDISASGVFIETRIPFAVGQTIIMKFRLPRSRKLIQAAGRIVRTSAQGIGVEFKRSAGKKRAQNP